MPHGFISEVTVRLSLFCGFLILAAIGCKLLLPKDPPNPPDPSDPLDTRLALEVNTPVQVCNPIFADSCAIPVAISVLNSALQDKQKIYLIYQFANDSIWLPSNVGAMSVNGDTLIAKILRIRRSSRPVYNTDIIRLAAVVDTISNFEQRIRRGSDLSEFSIRSPIISVALTSPLEPPCLDRRDFGGAKDIGISSSRSKLLIPAGSTITSMDLIECFTISLDLGNQLKGIAVMPNRPLALICMPNAREVLDFNIDSLKTLSQLTLEEKPDFVAVTFTSEFAYVISTEGNAVYVLDSLQNTLNKRNTVFLQNPRHVATGSVSQRGYVISKDGVLYILEPSLSVPVESISLGEGLSGKKIAVSPDETFAVVNVGTDENAFGVLFVDLDHTHQPAPAVLQLGSDVKDVAISPDQRYIFVTNVEKNGLAKRLAVLERNSDVDELLMCRQVIQLDLAGNIPNLIAVDYRMAYVISCDDRCDVNRVRLDLLDSNCDW